MGSSIPVISIIGLHGKEEDHIIRGIVGEPLPEEEVFQNLLKYKWIIENKYYRTETYLSKLKDNLTIDPSIFDQSEAIIVYIDSSKPHAQNDVDDILHFLENHLVDVKLLVCDGFKNCANGLSKMEAQDWCIKNGWELVELTIEEPESDHEDDLEDDFIDSWGFTRIKQALSAHTWSNLKLKGKEDSAVIDTLFKHLALQDGAGELEVPYKELEPMTDGEGDDDEDDFSALFSSLGQMKEKAHSLPPEERRIYAEKVAMAFLKSFGDEELSESDEGET